MAAPKTTAKVIKQAPIKPATLSTYGALPVTGYVRISDLRPILPFSDSTIWRRVRAGTFPAPVKLSERVTAWRAEDVREWLDSQPHAE